MIIKNNFNDKDANPLDDYTSVGRGSHSLDREMELEKEGYIKENMDNPVLRHLRGDDNENNEVEKKEKIINAIINDKVPNNIDKKF